MERPDLDAIEAETQHMHEMTIFGGYFRDLIAYARHLEAERKQADELREERHRFHCDTADRLTLAKQRIAELESALEPFDKACKEQDATHFSFDNPLTGYITSADIRRAAEVLRKGVQS